MCAHVLVQNGSFAARELIIAFSASLKKIQKGKFLCDLAPYGETG